MEHYGHLDLKRFGQLLNAVLHTLAEETDFTALDPNAGALTYVQSTGRIHYYNNEKEHKRVATLDDIRTVGNKTIISVNDPFGATDVALGDYWYNPTTGEFRVRVSNGWNSIQSTGTSVQIRLWNANETYPNLSVVNFGNALYQNLSGSDNNDAAWDAAKWTLVSGGSGAKVIKQILRTQVDGNTTDDVTRNGSTYTIVHGMNNEDVDYTLNFNGQNVYADFRIIDANSVSVTMKVSAEERARDYKVTIFAV